MSNDVLDRLDANANQYIKSRMQHLSFIPGERWSLHGPNLIFPLSGYLSVMSAGFPGEDAVEVLSIGRSGFFGPWPYLEHQQSMGDAIAQMAGSAWILPMADAQTAYDEHPSFRQSMETAIDLFIDQMAQTIHCATRHSSHQRVKRWLLQFGQIAMTDTFYATQEHISDALGLRRATISEALSELVKSNSISIRRGKIQLLNRPKIGDETCYECKSRFENLS